MSGNAKFKKEIQGRKKEFQNKKVELISRLCSSESKEIQRKQVAANKR